MSRNFIFTPEAEADVLAIWERIADNDSEKAADRVIASIYDECQKLGDMPGMGHYREDLLDQRHKFWSAWSYLLAYRWEVRPSRSRRLFTARATWVRSLPTAARNSEPAAPNIALIVSRGPKRGSSRSFSPRSRCSRPKSSRTSSELKNGNEQ